MAVEILTAQQSQSRRISCSGRSKSGQGNRFPDYIIAEALRRGRSNPTAFAEHLSVHFARMALQ